MEAHHVKMPIELQGKKGHLYYVEYHRTDFLGSGGGSSKFLTTLEAVQDWICEHVKEWGVDNGEVKFSVYPVHRVNPVDKMERERIIKEIFKENKPTKEQKKKK